jgi:hypothetical protein
MKEAIVLWPINIEKLKISTCFTIDTVMNSEDFGRIQYQIDSIE